MGLVIKCGFTLVKKTSSCFQDSIFYESWSPSVMISQAESASCPPRKIPDFEIVLSKRATLAFRDTDHGKRKVCVGKAKMDVYSIFL